ADRAYIAANNRLLALNLDTGKTAWDVELPDSHGSGWVVRSGKACVIVYPRSAIPAQEIAAVWSRVARSFRREPAGWRLPGLAATLYDAWVKRTVPVLLLDPETGKRI